MMCLYLNKLCVPEGDYRLLYTVLCGIGRKNVMHVSKHRARLERREKCVHGRQRGERFIASAARGGASPPFGCCSPTECGRPRAACRRKSDAVGREGCPPCPGFWPSRSQLCRRARRRA